MTFLFFIMCVIGYLGPITDPCDFNMGTITKATHLWAQLSHLCQLSWEPKYKYIIFNPDLSQLWTTKIQQKTISYVLLNISCSLYSHKKKQKPTHNLEEKKRSILCSIWLSKYIYSLHSTNIRKYRKLLSTSHTLN